MDMMFDTIITVDWSGGNQKPVTPSSDAIWVSIWRYGRQDPPLYFRNRQLVEMWLRVTLAEELEFKRRVFVGFDFAFGFPDGFAKAITGQDDPLAMWDWLEEHLIDSPNANNRFDIAGIMNARFDGIGPFWGNALPHDIEHLPRKGKDRTCTIFAERLQRLRRRFADQLAVWPFEPLDRPIAFIEIWPSLFKDEVHDNASVHAIKDAVQVHTMTQMIAAMDAKTLAAHLDVPATPEGWIFGVAP